VKNSRFYNVQNTLPEDFGGSRGDSLICLLSKVKQHSCTMVASVACPRYRQCLSSGLSPPETFQSVNL
jgi:hypothetical protein